MFVNIINKTNEEVEAKHNDLVVDLEKVVDEVYQVRVKSEGSGGQVLNQNADLVKQVSDLEAHLNTSQAAVSIYLSLNFNLV